MLSLFGLKFLVNSALSISLAGMFFNHHNNFVSKSGKSLCQTILYQCKTNYFFFLLYNYFFRFMYLFFIAPFYLYYFFLYIFYPLPMLFGQRTLIHSYRECILKLFLLTNYDLLLQFYFLSFSYLQMFITQARGN